MTKSDPAKMYVQFNPAWIAASNAVQNGTGTIIDGFDPDGIPRVWGSGPDATEAMESARLAASEYIDAKYSKGWAYFPPVTEWSFEKRELEPGTVAFKDSVPFKYWTGA